MERHDKFKELPKIANSWNIHDYNYSYGVEYSKQGMLGRGCSYENAHTVKTAYHFNGSGANAFGGAEQWPVVSMEITFEEGEEEKALKFAKKLMDFIEKNTK